ncbi:sugar kinase [Bacillus sp. 1P06AnD]|uniref:sugar kinase n=1 Tax=Bacillus sp. 1P06AnD TaxID=3132208 RepID=UPI0039A06186
MLDVITIGDAMITFNPVSKGPLRFVPAFERKVGGAEINVAVGCSRLGLKAGWISCLGNDEFGRHILHFARGENIDTQYVKLIDEYPTSLNFKEIREGGACRTFYYRHQSPIKAMSEEILEESYFKEAKLLHLSGVFMGIDENSRKIVRRAIALAKKNGLIISFDPNIRLKLWTAEEASKAIKEILSDVDILLTGEEEAEILFGTSVPEEIISYCESFGISNIAIKQGDKGAIGFKDGEWIRIEPVIPSAVVDTVGAGDGFNCGYIYGILQGWTQERTMELANRIGSMAVSVSGDNEGLPLIEEVMAEMDQIKRIER